MSKPNQTLAQRIRDYIAAHPERFFLLRELRDALMPDMGIEAFGGAVSSLRRQGHLHCQRRDGRNVYSYTPIAPRLRERTRPPKPTQKMRKQITGLARVPKPKSGTQKTAAQPRPNFTAAPSTADNTYCSKRLDSRRIAEDIAAFEAAGGHIERLGVTELFQD